MRHPVYLEHAMGSRSELDAELANYERKDDLVQRLQGYVTNAALEDQLKVYIPQSWVWLGTRTRAPAKGGCWRYPSLSDLMIDRMLL